MDVACFCMQLNRLVHAIAAGAGLRVSQHLGHADGIRQEPQDHIIFRSGLFADAPARQKWALFLAVAAYLGCSLCLFQGSRMGNGMSFGGYDQRVEQDIIFNGHRMHANDARLLLTDG